MGLSRARYTEKPPLRVAEAPVQEALRVLIGRHGSWSFWKLPHRLRKNGLIINHKPTQNAYIEHFNRSFRRELLDAHLFRSLAHVHQLVADWMLDYNTQRPHQALNFRTPIEFKQAA